VLDCGTHVLYFLIICFFADNTDLDDDENDETLFDNYEEIIDPFAVSMPLLVRC